SRRPGPQAWLFSRLQICPVQPAEWCREKSASQEKPQLEHLRLPLAHSPWANLERPAERARFALRHLERRSRLPALPLGSQFSKSYSYESPCKLDAKPMT